MVKLLTSAVFALIVTICITSCRCSRKYRSKDDWMQIIKRITAIKSRTSQLVNQFKLRPKSWNTDVKQKPGRGNTDEKARNRNKFLLLRKFAEKYEKVEYGKIAKYNVCPRTAGEEEEAMTKSLKRIMNSNNGIDKYRENNQKCSVKRRRLIRSTSTIADELTAATGIQGIIASYIGCNNVRDVQSSTLNMCKESTYELELPVTYFPQHHYHITCDNNGDFSCLYGEGTCIENVVYQPVFYGTGSNLQSITIPLTKSCSCQVINNSLFSMFV